MSFSKPGGNRKAPGQNRFNGRRIDIDRVEVESIEHRRILILEIGRIAHSEHEICPQRTGKRERLQKDRRLVLDILTLIDIVDDEEHRSVPSRIAQHL